MDDAPSRHVDLRDDDVETSRPLPYRIWEEDIPNERERTVTHHDAVVMDTASTAHLYKQGTLPAGQEESEATPLHLALRRRDNDSAKILADELNEQNVDVKDVFGLTALHLAIRLGDSTGSENDKILEVLLAKGADATAKSCTGRSAVEEASKLYNERFFEILTSHDKSINVERTPRDRKWSELRAYMIQEFADPNASTVASMMRAYSTTHDALSRVHQGEAGEILYWNIHDCIAEHVHEVACAAKRIPRDQLCAFYCREWQRFEKAAKHHRDSFRVLNRCWVAPEMDTGATDVSYIKELHSVIWKERLFHSVPLLIPSIIDLWRDDNDKEPGAEHLKNILRSSAESMIIDLERVIEDASRAHSL